MAKFMAALVCFAPGGKVYPVNCAHPTIKAGDHVLIRMKSQADSLRRAEVVEIILSPVECQNSVVCSQDMANEYRNGPFDVDDRSSLERFLSFLGYTRFATLYAEWQWSADADDDCNNQFISDNDEWPVAYVLVSRSIYGGEGEVAGENRIVLIGENAVARMSWGDGFWGGGRAYFRDKRFVVREFDHRISFDAFKDNPYRQAAQWAEELVSADYSDEPDTTQAEIRSTVNGGTGGPGYLSDDVWL